MPNVRDHDASVYLRLQGDALSVGGYEQNPIFWDEVSVLQGVTVTSHTRAHTHTDTVTIKSVFKAAVFLVGCASVCTFLISVTVWEFYPISVTTAAQTHSG